MSIRSRLQRIAERLRSLPPDPNDRKLDTADFLLAIDLLDGGLSLDTDNPGPALARRWCEHAARLGARRDGTERERIQRVYEAVLSAPPAPPMVPPA